MDLTTDWRMAEVELVNLKINKKIFVNRKNGEEALQKMNRASMANGTVLNYLTYEWQKER